MWVEDLPYILARKAIFPNTLDIIDRFASSNLLHVGLMWSLFFIEHIDHYRLIYGKASLTTCM